VQCDNSPGHRPGKKEKGKGSLKGFAIILQDGLPKRQLDPAYGARLLSTCPLPHLLQIAELQTNQPEAGVLNWDLNRPARAALKIAQSEVPKGPSPGLQPTPESSPAKGDTCP